MSKKFGFTLIELLVVIAIFSVLASIVFGSLNQARGKSRDSKRVQDLVQLRNALELYKAEHGRYPDDKDALPVIGDQPAGIDCWECDINSGDTCDSFDNGCTTLHPLYSGRKLATDLLPYINPLPSDPSVPSTGWFNDTCAGVNTDRRGYWYKANANGSDYKVVIFGTIEDINVIPPPMRADGINTPIWRASLCSSPGATATIYSSEISRNWTESLAGGPNTNLP